MPRTKTVPVSLTPEARTALRDITMDLTIATRERATMSDALMVARLVIAQHRDELAGHWAAVKGRTE